MNAVFLHIPKTAGLSIEQSLALWSLRNHHRIRRNFDQEGVVSFGHMNYLKLLRLKYVSEEFDKSAWKFCFCRNPYDRAVSHYFYARWKHPEILDPALSFLDFTRTIPGGKKGKFQPQSNWIEGVGVDFIGRYENLEEDVRLIAKKLKRTVLNLIHRNSSHHKSYPKYYCEESKANIEQFYSIDFKTFDYEHDDNLLHR